MKKPKIITIDKETVDSVREFQTETRLQEIQESLDRVFGKWVNSSHCDDSWTDEEVAKLDYILCEIENVIHKNRDVVMRIKG